MNIDFPLILVILVFGSGLIWVLDAMFLARGRKVTCGALREEYPDWATEGSEQSSAYRAQLAQSASEPVSTAMR